MGPEAEKDAKMEFGAFCRRARSKFQRWRQQLKTLWKRATNMIKFFFKAPKSQELVHQEGCEIRSDMGFEEYMEFLNEKYKSAY